MITPVNTADTVVGPVLIQGTRRVDVSIAGNIVAGSVLLERSKQETSDYNTVKAYTTEAEETGTHGSAWYYRLRTSSDFSGQVRVILA